MPSSMRSAAAARPAAANAIIQCGNVKTDRQSPMRCSALFAISIHRSPTSTPCRSKSEQHRGSVLDVDDKIRLRLRERRPQIAEPTIVEQQHPFELPALIVEQRAVPP